MRLRYIHFWKSDGASPILCKVWRTWNPIVPVGLGGDLEVLVIWGITTNVIFTNDSVAQNEGEKADKIITSTDIRLWEKIVVHSDILV